MKRTWQKSSNGYWCHQAKIAADGKAVLLEKPMYQIEMAEMLRVVQEGTILTLDEPDPEPPPKPKQTWTRAELERAQKKYAGHPMAISAIEDLLQQVEKGGA